MAPAASSGCALAPLFRARKIRPTNVTLPVELVLDIVRLAAAPDARAARVLASVCRIIRSEVDRYRFRVLRWRNPREGPASVIELAARRGRWFLVENLQALYWDWSCASVSWWNQWADVRRCVQWIRSSPAELRLSTLALNVELVVEFADMVDLTVLEELMIIYDPHWEGRPAALHLPYQHLARLLLHNFAPGCWPDAVIGCTALGRFADDALDRLPLLKRFLIFLVDDGDLPQFKNTAIYADALRPARDARVRIDFDAVPCNWHARWWRSRTAADEPWSGSDFWDTGCTIPQHLPFAKPPLSYFLHHPYE
ncbi:hypothetical protein AURDEDRAFT_187733 [Auricularia subglabra TFB-10046 SS5]|nr:hypothetical protein AURDEDRAFT_187733 [Auricularia subglabra TFB-10046 SS5]